MPDPTQIKDAAIRLAPYIVRTPVRSPQPLHDVSGVTAFLKMEQLQRTGSFKFRGAANKILQVRRRALDEGVVAASTGNHGLAVAAASMLMGGRSIVYVPETAAQSKIDAMRKQGAEIRTYGRDGVEAEKAARDFAEEHHLIYISPYNDPDVIAGQGTVGYELGSQLSEIDSIYVAVGGGGLIAGISTWFKTVHPNVRIVGCSPERSAVMHHSVAAGRILEMPSADTISDGTAGGIEPDAITFPLCRRLVDDWILVSEEQIIETLGFAIQRLHLRIEGSAAVAIAGMIQDAAPSGARKSVAIVCGGNIAREQLERFAGAQF